VYKEAPGFRPRPREGPVKNGFKRSGGRDFAREQRVGKCVEAHLEPFLPGPTQAQPSPLDAHCVGAAQEGH
jgi:hypothetical protein